MAPEPPTVHGNHQTNGEDSHLTVKNQYANQNLDGNKANYMNSSMTDLRERFSNSHTTRRKRLVLVSVQGTH